MIHFYKIAAVLVLAFGAVETSFAEDGCTFDNHPFWSTQHVTYIHKSDDQMNYITIKEVKRFRFPFHRVTRLNLLQTKNGNLKINNFHYNFGDIEINSLSEYDFDRLIQHMENQGCSQPLTNEVKKYYNPENPGAPIYFDA